MILKIDVKNCNWFGDISLSFESSSNKNISSELETPIILNGKKIIRVLSVVGANASGKSTLLRTLETMVTFFEIENIYDDLHSLIINKEIIKLRTNNTDLFDKNGILNPLLQENVNKLANHTLNEQNEIFKIFRKIEGNKNILESWLELSKYWNNFNEKNLTYSIVSFDTKTNKEYVTEITVHSAVPRISIIIDGSHFLVDFQTDNFLIVMGTAENIKRKLNEINFPLISSLFISKETLEPAIIKDKPFPIEGKEKLIQWIKMADSEIENVFIYGDKKEFYSLNSFKYNDNIGERKIEFLSTGTIRWILLYYKLFLEKNNFYLIDEIDFALSPKLVKFLISEIAKSNKQIIFTSHNPLIFGNVFRTDALYFLKDKKINRLSDLEYSNDSPVIDLILDDEMDITPKLNHYLKDWLT